MKNMASFLLIGIVSFFLTSPGVSLCTKRSTCVGILNQCILKNVDDSLIGEKRQKMIERKCEYEWSSCLTDKVGCEREDIPGKLEPSPSQGMGSGFGSESGSSPKSICTKLSTCIGILNQCILKNVDTSLIGEKRQKMIEQKCEYEWSSCLTDKIGCEREDIPGKLKSSPGGPGMGSGGPSGPSF